MTRIRVLLIQNYITHYNLPIYNLLGMNPSIDLTIAHYGKHYLNSNYNFKEVLFSIKKIGPFFFHKGNLLSYCNGYDVVIAMSDIHFLSLMMLGKRKKKSFKLVYWGIGVSASYKNKLDDNKKWDFIRFYFMRSANALLFYSSYPIKRYINNGFSKEKLFVANNTVEVKRIMSEPINKNSILFIGTLYKEKGIYELLLSYKEAYKMDNSIPNLNIIGDGSEYKKIEYWINENNLQKKVILHGAIYDDIRLELFFQKAYVTISPSQAGLSVLKSMGYGVPFITRNDSITGGERFNIINNKTGIIYGNDIDLINILGTINTNKYKYLTMGKNAQEFYQNFRMPKHMVQGFIDVINYVTK